MAADSAWVRHVADERRSFHSHSEQQLCKKHKNEDGILSTKNGNEGLDLRTAAVPYLQC